MLDCPDFTLPGKLAAELRKDLLGDPSPAAKLHGADNVLAQDALRLASAARQIDARRGGLWANHRHALDGGPRQHRWASEHPHRCHEPLTRPSLLIEETFEFFVIDIAVVAKVNSDGEAVDADRTAQRAISSQKKDALTEA